ncbi:MAG: aminoacyl-histidine dipeptidase [Syntrophobacterales bacterium]|nr:MAG: aminoacyl-histidine dipeptidase [Syntrophobacterales bacterium]
MSDTVIKGLRPEMLWRRFYEISQIPRPSKKEGKILQYLRNIAKELSLKMREDSAGNIVMSVKATPGYENAKTVVLQSHVDMVCEKNKETDHDFTNDPIKLVRDNGWIKAEGTTLGSDNGIGVAASIAVASDKDVAHGPLELLFTVDEETGLTGANNLRPGFITGKTLLNLDSEEGGSFYVGCSGGQDTVGVFKIEEMNASSGFGAYELLIGGLKGGHSGLDIHLGRANAIKLLGRLFKKLEGIHYQVAEISGGSRRNVIPREAEATILLNPSDEEAAQEIISNFFEEALMEYKKNDGGLKIELKKKGESFNKAFSKEFLAKIGNVILALPHGVIAMSPDIPDLVETSTNLATIIMEQGKIKIETSQRSSLVGAKAYIASIVESLFKLADAEISSGGGYPGWKPNLNSEILRISIEVYKKLFKKEPEVKAVHAGLECAILGDKYPGLDMVSLGPTIQGAHSPDERVNIHEVERFYNLLKGILLELTAS